jgi:hypothetical protein
MKHILAVILIATFSGAFAQMPDPTPVKVEMKKLSAWAGRWKGEGSMRMGPGEPKNQQ